MPESEDKRGWCRVCDCYVTRGSACESLYERTCDEMCEEGWSDGETRMFEKLEDIEIIGMNYFGGRKWPVIKVAVPGRPGMAANYGICSCQPIENFFTNAPSLSVWRKDMEERYGKEG